MTEFSEAFFWIRRCEISRQCGNDTALHTGKTYHRQSRDHYETHDMISTCASSNALSPPTLPRGVPTTIVELMKLGNADMKMKPQVMRVTTYHLDK